MGFYEKCFTLCTLVLEQWREDIHLSSAQWKSMEHRFEKEKQWQIYD